MRISRQLSLLGLSQAVMLIGYLLAANTLSAETSNLVSQTSFRVCSDPANSPLSTQHGAGFENQIAELMANKLDLPLEYFWLPMSMGFIRNSLASNKCDVVIGYSAGHELVLNSNHYYTSVYILVAKAGEKWAKINRLSDPLLAQARIGITAGAAPATHLAKYGLAAHIEPYHLFVDRRHYSPNEQMLEDLKKDKIQVAILWGPLGAPVAKKHSSFVITPLLHERGKPQMFYRITMGVRRGEVAWKRKLNSLIRRHHNEIDAILRDFGVPLLTDRGDALKPTVEQ